MSLVLWIVMITAISGVVGTGLGGVVGCVFKKDSSKVVSLLLSFAAGVMLAVVCFDLIPESIEMEKDGNKISYWITVIGVLFGYGIVYLLNHFIDRHTNKEVDHVSSVDHPKTADALDELIHADHFKSHKKSGSQYQLFIAGIIMACAIALHNMPEGMVIGASYANVGKDVVVGSPIPQPNYAAGSGFILAIVIGLHNIPEGMAVAVPLIAGGMKKWLAVLVTAILGIPTIIGALIGFYVGSLSPIALAIALSFASGAMLYVVLGELLPEAFLLFKSKLPALFVLVGILLGLVLVQI